MHKNSHLTAQLLLPLAGPQAVAKTPSHLRAKQVVAIIRQFNQRLFQETDGAHARFFKEIVGPSGEERVRVDQLETIAEKALGDGSIFYNPEELDKNDIQMVMSHAWAGTPLDTNVVKKGSLQIR